MEQNIAQKQRDYFYSMLSSAERELLHYLPTVADLMKFAAKEYGRLPAISDGKCITNYEQLAERVAARRGYLKSLGLKKGDRIAVYSQNTVEAMELYLAITTGGYVSLMLPAALDSKTLFALCGKFKISHLFYDKSLADNIPDSVSSCSTQFVDAAPEDYADLAKDDICSICLTGGTTGTPKGAVLTHGAIMRGAFNGCLIPGGVLYQKYIAILPFSHIFGLVKGFLSCLYTGSYVVECRDVKRAFTEIPVLKPTTLVLVPGMAEIIVGLSKKLGKDYCRSLKTAVIGAAPVSPKLMKELDVLGINVLAGYGLTEGANLSAGNKAVLENPDSMGMIYPEQQFKTVDGELLLKGDNLMLGYFDDEEATKAAFDEDGWLKTGDLARFDEDGHIYIVGRIKNLIILDNGENVSPEEIEEIFNKEAMIKDCLVKEDKIGERTVIAIDILPDYLVTGEMSDEVANSVFSSIVAKINKTLPDYKKVSKFTVKKEDFKRTNSMKIARNQE